MTPSLLHAVGTVVMTSEEADYYNGQQGDIWDAQKDMASAMLGSTMQVLLYLIGERSRGTSKRVV